MRWLFNIPHHQQEYWNRHHPAGSLQYIAYDAFTGCTNMVATVSEKSYAHEWCVEKGINIIVE